MVARHCCTAALILALAGACSSRPREFVATLQAPPADQAKYQAAHESCRVLVARGQRSGFGSRLASGGAGAAGVGAGLAVGAGVGAAAAGGTAASSVAAAGAAASAALIMMPVLGIGAAWGFAKARKSKKERQIKDAMALCLAEQGYDVGGWKVTKRKHPAR